MPKQRRSDSDECGGGRKATRRPTMRRRLLYLVLDDWSLGYSIRKIDLAAYGCYAGLPHLPKPIVQLEAPPRRLDLSMYFAASSGSSKIMAMHPQRNDARCFDVRSRSLVYGPRPYEVRNPWNNSASPVFIPVGDDRLCALWGRSLQLLEPPPEESGGDLWSWRELHEELPYDSSCVASYAAHPDGRTVFVTFKKKPLFDRCRGGWPEPTRDTTLCLDLDVDGSAESCALRGEFDWALPFQGRSYFVSELNAWVGLCPASFDTVGHLCACSVPVIPAAAGSGSGASASSPSWKISKEGVFSDNLAELYQGATLVYTGGGGGSEFCLVEIVTVGYSYVCEGPLEPQPYCPLSQLKDRSHHPLLRLTTFSLVVDENGDLMTGNTRRHQYYSLPEPVPITRSSTEFPVAFWL